MRTLVYSTKKDWISPDQRISAQIAKDFRRMVYMDKRSPIIKPAYVLDKTLFWEDVHTFFLQHNIPFTHQAYKFMCAFGIKEWCEMIMDIRQVKAKHLICQNDIVIVQVSGEGNRTITLHHIWDKYSRSVHPCKLKGFFVYDEQRQAIIAQIRSINKNNRTPVVTIGALSGMTVMVNILDSIINS